MNEKKVNPQDKYKKKKIRLVSKVAQRDFINIVILIPEWFKQWLRKKTKHMAPDTKSSYSDHFFERTAAGILKEDSEPRGGSDSIIK